MCPIHSHGAGGGVPGCQTNLAPPTTFEVGKFSLESLRWDENYAQFESDRTSQIVTDLRKPVAATPPPQEIMCLCVWLRRFLVLPGTTLPVRTAKVFNMGEERRRSAFHSASTSGASRG
ncbi:unnamed protein product [Pleuronectes platessa]|uniref:Uncharacterized protein n=1 Tax=Pleuronectes platessa TaxID=8262 RepID=A0A9N7Z376_PLEPL|nr:unnamed protein product [Pleuronectes platessa]